jgi:hypothetical protein
MIERVTVKSIEFANPFKLVGVEKSQPAGIYAVETVEEQLEGVSFVAYRRLSTTISLHGNTTATASRQVTDVDPIDLAAALDRDRAQT